MSRQNEDSQITADEAKRIRLALIFGDPAAACHADPALEVAKAKLGAIEAEAANRGRSE